MHETNLRQRHGLAAAVAAAFTSLLLLTSCGSPSGQSASRRSVGPLGSPAEGDLSETPSPGPSPSPTPSQLPAQPLPYELGRAEVHPDVKREAARIAQALTTYLPNETPETIVGRIARSETARKQLLADAAPLLVPGARSAGTVVYPQLGGRPTDRASVMVVVRQQLHASGQEQPKTVTRTLDIRLQRVNQMWQFERLPSAGGQPPTDTRKLSATAQAVLADRRITLPDSARWDIQRGGVSEGLLKTMLAMAGQAPYAVAVITSGHPHEVFGTNRTSRHTHGRAVDVYSIGGQLVIEQRGENTLAHRTARWLFGQGVSELGSPWAFDAYGGRSFTDVVHQDHLHVGVGG